MLTIFFVLLGIILISYSLTAIIRRYVMAKNILDIPNLRSSHQLPTPRGGGAAFVCLFTLCAVWLYYQHWISSSLFYALSGGVVIAAIGGLDDVLTLKAWQRALIQFLVSAGCVYCLGNLQILGTSIFASVITMTGIVWCINLYNFMDGIDGLAASEGIFISLGASLIFLLSGSVSFMLLCLLLAASLFGFLLWNWSPAKIFMGDVGSGYLGYIFAVICLASVNANLMPFSSWAILTAVFTADASFTVIKRKFQGKRWYEAHREHAYQCLIRTGLSHRRVTMYILLFNIGILFPAAYIVFAYSNLTAYLILPGFLLLYSLWYKIVKLQPFELVKGTQSNV